MAERQQFSKMIIPGSHRGTVIIKEAGHEDQIINGGKEQKLMPSELLSNLRSLAMQSEGTFEDSTDQEYFNQEIERIKLKYPGEQPEEVWRRSLATCMKEGLSISDVARTLLSTNLQFNIGKSIGSLSEDEKADKLQRLEDQIRSYWPHPKSK